MFAACCTGDELYGSTRVGVVVGNDHTLVMGPETLVGMFVSLENDVHSEVVENVLQSRNQ